jgi:Berberine and berberine like
MFEVGMAMDPVMGAAVTAYLPVVKGALGPWDSGREFLNFAERRTDARRLWSDESYERLREVKSAYDPADVFRSNHPVSASK